MKTSGTAYPTTQAEICHLSDDELFAALENAYDACDDPIVSIIEEEIYQRDADQHDPGRDGVR